MRRAVLKPIAEEPPSSILNGTCLEDTPMAIYAKLLDIAEYDYNMYGELAFDYYQKYDNDAHHYACLAVRCEGLQEASINSREFFIDIAEMLKGDLNKINCLYTAANVSTRLFLDDSQCHTQKNFINILDQYKNTMMWHTNVDDKNKFSHILLYLVVINELIKKFSILVDVQTIQDYKNAFDNIKIQTGIGDDLYDAKEEDKKKNPSSKNIKQLINQGNEAWFQLRFDDMQHDYRKALKLDKIDEQKMSEIGDLMNIICQPQYHNVSVYYAVPLKEIKDFTYTERFKIEKSNDSGISSTI